ncbi:TraM recognition domain-containing protein [Amorphus sp. 3PC139-8]|uniref:TraM recognition domain-containing protein n=1 Tax=Amorphus sp. 3PC139-8 TaxID=2735676 RepID=UPI00345D27F7
MSEPKEARTQDAARGVVASAQIRRKVRRPSRGFIETISGGDFAFVSLLCSALALLVLPSLFLLVVPLALTYYLWLTGLKIRLPFRAPITWPGPDYGNTSPTGKPRSASGIFYGGFSYDDGQALWITNDDARRHILVMGTTGSGKALPDDALVLTPVGWRRNRELRVGDALWHPDGSLTFVESVHPQGRQPVCRLEFEDGRIVECTPEHLWQVRIEGRVEMLGSKAPGGAGGDGFQVMEAKDLGILLGVHQGDVEIFVPLIEPYPGIPGSQDLTEGDGRKAYDVGFVRAVGGMADQCGSVQGRRAFLRGYLSAAKVRATAFGMEVGCSSKANARALRQLVWSLGGLAMVIQTNGRRHGRRSGWALRFHGPGFDELMADEVKVAKFSGKGVRLVGLEPGPRLKECRCIKTTRADGLYITDGYVTTHNTELMLGYVSQSLMWSSGFAFIDGKGANDLYPRVWSLARRFGREDDVRLISFKNPETLSDAPAGGPAYETNTLNPFAKGSDAELRNIIDSLMGESSGADSMWRGRAASLVAAVIRILVNMRDRNELLLDVQAIRDYLPLGLGIKRSGRPEKGVEPTEEEWKELANRPGLIELYLRALNGDFSDASRLQLKAFFDTLPGFSMDAAMQGKPQEGKTIEQYGYLSMQLTKPLGTLADDFAHVFRTALGEVDMEDVVQNRRILVVLLPALEKAPEEMKNLGRVIVSLFRIMMGKAAGGTVVGTREQVIESRPTVARMPFILVLDEAGYYLTKGVDTMFAQGRSLGFQQVVGLQDVTALKESAPHLLDTVTANTNLFAIGKTVDSSLTYEFVKKRVGSHTVAVSSGYSSKTGFAGTNYVDRGDITFKEEDRIPLPELNGLDPGVFYYLFDGVLVKANCFYVGDGIKDGKEYADSFAINKFLPVRGPFDRAPNLDQSREIAFEKAFVDCTRQIGSGDVGRTVTGRVCREGLLSAAGTAAAAVSAASRDGGAGVDPSLVAVCAGGLRRLQISIQDEFGEYEEEPPTGSAPPFAQTDDEEEVEAAGGGMGLRNQPMPAPPVFEEEEQDPFGAMRRPRFNQEPVAGSVRRMLDEEAPLPERAKVAVGFLAANPWGAQFGAAVEGEVDQSLDDDGPVAAMAGRLAEIEKLAGASPSDGREAELKGQLTKLPAPTGIVSQSPELVGRMLNVLSDRLSQ